MVGVPRSTGCATCVQRRIKCDEGRPGCQKCQRAGKTCPGYTRQLIFKNSTAGDAKRKKREVTTSLSPTDPGPPESRRDSLMVQTPPKPRVESLHAPQTEQLQAMSSLIDNFAPPSAEPTSGPSYLREWLSHVYYHIGKNPALDLAMRSSAVLQCGLKNKDSRSIGVSRSIYVGALHTLQRALTDPRSSHAELQSTVMLLTFYELMSNRKEDEWIRHSGGSTELMRLRGPKAYADRNSFDHKMYLVCRYYIVMEAFYKAKACFLDDPEWNSLACDPDSKEGNLRERMFQVHVQIPGMLRDAKKAAVGQYDPFELIKRAVDLRVHVQGLYEKWIVELTKAGDMPTEIPGEDDVFPTVLHFHNLAVHGFMSQHCSTIIILDSILIDCGLPNKEQLMEERRYMAAHLCKCAQFAQGRVLGSILLHFWLITAERAADPRYKEWILKKRASLQR